MQIHCLRISSSLAVAVITNEVKTAIFTVLSGTRAAHINVGHETLRLEAPRLSTVEYRS